MTWTFTAGAYSRPSWTPGSQARASSSPARRRDRRRVRARVRRRGREVLVHYHRAASEPRPARRRARRRRASAPTSPTRPRSSGCFARARGARRHARRLCRGRGRLAVRGPAGLGAPARALGGDAAREPDRDVPDRARLPARRRAHAATARSSSSARPRAASAKPGTPTTRPRSRRSRAGCSWPEERGRPRRAVGARQRRRARLDGVADDARARSTRTTCAAHPDDGAAEGRAPRGRRRAVVVLASDALSGHVSRRGRHGRRRHGRPRRSRLNRTKRRRSAAASLPPAEMIAVSPREEFCPLSAGRAAP